MSGSVVYAGNGKDSESFVDVVTGKVTLVINADHPLAKGLKQSDVKVQVHDIGGWKLYREELPHVGVVHWWERPEGGKAEVQSDFNGIGAAVWELIEKQPDAATPQE